MKLFHRRLSSKGYVPVAANVNVAAALSVGVLVTVLVGVAVMFPGGAWAAQRLLVLGDSLTAGYGLNAPDGFTPRLEEALRAAGRDVTVLNGGVSGDTTAGGRARVAWALGDKPDAVIVELGANDGLRGLDPKATFANLDAIVTTLRDAGLPVLLAGMLVPPNLGQDYAAEFNAIYPRLAEKHGVALYPFFLDGVAAKPELNQDDGIHPNPDGVREVVRRILPMVLELLDRAAKKAGAS